VPILSSLQGPGGLRGLSDAQLAELAQEIRETIIATVATTGGHLGSSLGVVEVTIALHRLLDSPRDKVVWDTGHQAYAHKLLTGRLDRFDTLRQVGGIGGFPRRSESEHDVVDGGHAGTGLSIAAGLATARDLRHGLERIAVVVGDAALMSGLSLEALNDIGHRRVRLLIVLNDNEMSISPTVGALSRYLSEIKLSSTWERSKRGYDRFVERVPAVGPTALELSRRLRKSVVSFAQPGQLFEDLGIVYVGVIPGHDLRALEHTFGQALELDGPVLVHVRTQKGRGYRPAERDRVAFHGAALPPMAGHAMRARTAPPVFGAGEPSVSAPAGPANGEPVLPAAESSRNSSPNYTAHFAAELVAAARADHRIVAITAGMPTGTGLQAFANEFPDRFIDVGIAEQHAVTLATGLALGGQRPVVALYSTFLQRAFDQVVHDVCQNDAAVLIAVDRAGLVGEDGTSHQGMFTLPAQLQLPHLVVASPRDEQELRAMVRTGLACDHPFALHYPRDPGQGVAERPAVPLPIGRGEVLREGTDILLVGFGPIVARGAEVATALAAEGVSAALVNARFAKPLDRQLILDQARGKRLVITLEESTVAGGFGAAVLATIEGARLVDPAYRDLVVRMIGIPADRFVDHGDVAALRGQLRLDAAGIAAQVREAMERLGGPPGAGSPAAPVAPNVPVARPAAVRQSRGRPR
jgi:1-deoxy-D-xylulose-5-phosphate synthase